MLVEVYYWMDLFYCWHISTTCVCRLLLVDVHMYMYLYLNLLIFACDSTLIIFTSVFFY